ncbi:acetyltransferase [Fusobacterium varium]|uniref:acetyltransferase n=1 Tax=Fusobacterium varium TaxID=856 RepID=UPI003568933B
MKDIVIIGAGGFAREVIWLIEEINMHKKEWNILGLIDDALELIGKEINNYKVLGNIEYLNTLDKEIYATIAIGNGNIRKEIIEKVKNRKYATLIHPNVQKSKFVKIEEGVIICSNNILTVNIEIGKHSIINLNSTIGHDVKLKDYVTILPGCNISGNVNIGESSVLGTGTTIIQNKKVGKNVIIGAGTVVIRDIEDNCTVVGNPAKVIKRNDYEEK